MCKQCETKPVYEFTNKRKLCKNCYIRWFEKKFLYVIRKNSMLKSGDVAFCCHSSKGFREVALKNLLEMFAKKGTVEVVSNPKAKGMNKIVRAFTSDTVSYEIVKALFEGKVSDFKSFNPVKGKEIYPLFLFLDKEVGLYCKLKGLKFVKKAEKKNDYAKLVDSLEKKHPEIKQAIVRGYLDVFG